MSVKIEVNGEVVVAYLSGDIDHHTAKPIREEIDAAADKNMPELLVLDFKDVTFMDSSGIGLVMGRYKLLSPRGCELAVTNGKGFAGYRSEEVETEAVKGDLSICKINAQLAAVGGTVTYKELIRGSRF